MDLGTIQYNVEANTTDLDRANEAVDAMGEQAKKTGAAVDGMSKKAEAAFRRTASEAEKAAARQVKDAERASKRIQEENERAALAAQKHAERTARILQEQATKAANAQIRESERAAKIVAQQAAMAAQKQEKSAEQATKKNQQEAEKARRAQQNQSRSGLQNIGWQAQDAIVQFQMGTSAATILSQQGSQLASAWNPLLGLFVAVAGVVGGALYSAFGNATESTEELSEKIRELNKDYSSLMDEQRAVLIDQQTNKLKTLNEQIEKQTQNIGDLENKYAEMQATFARQQSPSMVTGFAGGQSDIVTQQSLIDMTEKLRAARGALATTNQEVMLTDQDILRLNGEKLAGDKENLTVAEELIKSLENERAKIDLVGGAMADYLADKSKATEEERALIQMLYMGNEARKEIEEQNKKAAKEREDANKRAIADEQRRAEALSKSIAELQKQNELFGNQSKYAEILYQIKIGTLDAADAQVQLYLAAAQANDQLVANKNLADSMESFAKKSEEDNAALDSLISSVDEFGGAWSRTGSIVADSLGTIGDALSDYSSRMESIASKESRLAEARMKFMGDPKQIEKISRAEKKLASERTAANLKSFGAIAGAASEMFDEQSKARKTLHGIEMTLSAIEIAMTLKKTAASAVEGVVNQSKGDPYSAFARMAAMAAIMAGLGYAVGGGFSGGGGGTSAAQVQEDQGTGSVLGSNSKSDSVLSAIEQYSDIGLEQLSVLRGIRDSLQTFAGGIEELSMSVSASQLADKKYFAFQNMPFSQAMSEGLYIGGSKKEHAEMRAALAPMQGQIKNVLGFMSETVTEGVKSLGLDFERSINSYWIDIGKVSFQDMSAEEINQELAAIFSKEADLLTAYLVPSLLEFQQMGEGLFETLTRVAAEMATFNYYTEALNLNFDAAGLSAIAAQQAISDFSGGMDKLTENMQTYYEEFFSEQERAANQMKLLTAEMKNLGYDTVPTTREAFRALVEGIDLTTEAGQKQFAGLVSLSEVFADLVPLTKELSANAAEAAMSLLERSVAAEKKIISDQVELLNTALGTSRAVFNALESSLKGMTISSARTQAATRADAQRQISSMLVSARGGMLPNINDLSGALSAVSQPSEKLFATFEDYATDLYRTAGEIRELKDIAGEQVGTDEKALSELQKQSELLDDIVLWGREQIDIMAGVDTRITSVADALIGLSSIIGVTYPTVEQQKMIAQMAQSSEKTRSDLKSSQDATNAAIQAQAETMKSFSDYVKATQFSIVDNTDKIKKVLEKFDAIGMPIRDESIAGIVDPIVDAVTP